MIYVFVIKDIVFYCSPPEPPKAFGASGKLKLASTLMGTSYGLQVPGSLVKGALNICRNSHIVLTRISSQPPLYQPSAQRVDLLDLSFQHIPHSGCLAAPHEPGSKHTLIGLHMESIASMAKGY